MRLTEKNIELAKYVAGWLDSNPTLATIADVAVFFSSKWFIYCGVLALYLLGYIQMLPTVAAFVFGIPLGALLIALIIAAVLVFNYIRGVE